MSQNMESNNVMLDSIKWILVLAVASLSAFANVRYSSEFSVIIQAFAWIVAIGAITALAFSTKSGRALFNLLVESRNELRRVIWPTRDETVRMTLLVVAMVIIMGIVLWTFDIVLLKFVGWLTGFGASY